MTQTSAPAPEPAPVVGDTIDLGRCFNEAFDVYRTNFWLLCAAGLLVTVLSVVSLFILLGPLSAGLSLLCLNALAHPRHQVMFDDLFRGFRFFFPALGLLLLMLVPMVLATMLFVIPAIFLYAVWLYPFFLLVDRRTGVFQSLRLSYRMAMRAGYGRHLGIAALIILLDFGAGAVGSQIHEVLGLLTSAVVMPFGTLLAAVAYRQIVLASNVDGGSSADLAAALATPDPALCGNCRYALRSVTTFHCPECGADLREVGMIPSRGLRD